jgi:hypothetical protein
MPAAVVWPQQGTAGIKPLCGLYLNERKLPLDLQQGVHEEFDVQTQAMGWCHTSTKAKFFFICVANGPDICQCAAAFGTCSSKQCDIDTVRQTRISCHLIAGISQLSMLHFTCQNSSHVRQEQKLGCDLRMRLQSHLHAAQAAIALVQVCQVALLGAHDVEVDDKQRGVLATLCLPTLDVSVTL